MKKLLFALTVLCALMCMSGLALAEGHPCDMCGGSTTLEGSGAWCHWYCEKCDYTTSRNHDPNSYYSGLEPDSCSGYCRWCGAAANYSSHTFTTWVGDGNATCLADGTETAQCGNAQCWATSTRTASGSAMGHDHVQQVVPATCDEGGYTIYTCSRCADTYNDSATSPLGHQYGDWRSNGDGTHTADCVRYNCYHRRTADCASTTAVVSGKELTLCPVCGGITFEGGSTDLELSGSTSGRMVDGSSLPGRLMVLVDEAPLELGIESEAFYMFITSFQRGGLMVEGAGKVEITVDLNEHPFVMETSAFGNMLPAEMNARAFKIVRVEYETVEGKLTEVWHEMPFTLEEGVLTFETEKMGVFLMALKITMPPAAE